MGNCQCWHANLNEPTLGTRIPLPDELNVSALPPRLAKLAEKAISNTTCDIKTIDLSNRELGEEGAMNFHNILQYYTHIQALLLPGTRLSADHLNTFSENLIECSKLLELDLSHNLLGPKGAEKLASILPRFMKLEILKLQEVSLESAGMIYLSEGLTSLKNLKELNVSENKIGDSGIKILASVVGAFPKLKAFDIHHNEISIAGCVFIGNCLKVLNELEVFKVGSNFLMKDGGNTVVTQLPATLKQLWMESTGLEDSHIILFAPIMSSFVGLEVLILDQNLIGPKGAEVLTTCLPKLRLKTLSLVGCDVSLYRKALSVASEGTEVLI
jgi:Ran GTPase-activating protein (RanGAP) involved in mRNA processing and transport